MHFVLVDGLLEKVEIFPFRISKKSDSQNDAKESEMSFSRSSKKDLPNDVALDEVNKHITDTLSILRREISKVRKEKEALICIRQAGSGGRQGQFVLLRCCEGKPGRVSKVFKLASVLM